MDLTIELAKGILQYAPSYIGTLVQILTSPVTFLLEVLRSPEKEEELKKAFSFAFLTLILTEFLTALQSGPGKFATTLIVDGAIKIIQISGLVVIMHLALRIVAVTVDRFALTAVALYQVSIGNLVLTMIMLAVLGYGDEEVSNTVLSIIIVILALPILVVVWTALYRGLHIGLWKAVASFLFFFTMFYIFGNIMKLMMGGVLKQLN